MAKVLAFNDGTGAVSEGHMQRREFITLIGGAAAWPLAAQAQQPALPVVGFLGSGSPQSDAFRVAAIRQGLIESGYVDGRNVAFEYCWAEDHYERLPALAADLVRRGVAVIEPAASLRPLRPKPRPRLFLSSLPLAAIRLHLAWSLALTGLAAISPA